METMTFRVALSVTLVALAAACGAKTKTGDSTPATAGRTPDSAAGAIGDTVVGKLPPNHMGRIPVLEYHVIGGDKNALYTRTVASFKADLEDVYRRGYRPITIAQMLDKNFSDVPEGMSPVIFVFDD